MVCPRRPAYGQAMTKKNLFTASAAGLIAFTSLLTALTGCAPAASSPAPVAEAPAPAPVAAPATATAFVVQDDYDYYPGYEVYYSRNRHEYVYRDGNSWVRRPQPRGITVDLLFAAPSVRVDFHDAPERHHDVVIRSYPRNWKRPDNKHDDRDDKKDDRKKN